MNTSSRDIGLKSRERRGKTGNFLENKKKNQRKRAVEKPGERPAAEVLQNG